MKFFINDFFSKYDQIRMVILTEEICIKSFFVQW